MATFVQLHKFKSIHMKISTKNIFYRIIWASSQKRYKINSYKNWCNKPLKYIYINTVVSQNECKMQKKTHFRGKATPKIISFQFEANQFIAVTVKTETHTNSIR